MSRIARLAPLALALAAPAQAEELARQTSEYNGTLIVREDGGLRALYTESRYGLVQQSVFDPRQPERVIPSYAQIMALVTGLHPRPARAFNLGLGGGALPRFFMHRYATGEVVSAEIDPAVVTLATRYFAARASRHTILVGDGAARLREQARPFDVIWVDAFGKDGVPEVVRSADFVASLRQKLRPGGLAVANLWLEQPAALDALARRYRAAFAHGVRVDVPGDRNDIIVVSDSDAVTCGAVQALLAASRASGLATALGSGPLGCRPL